MPVVTAAAPLPAHPLTPPEAPVKTSAVAPVEAAPAADESKTDEGLSPRFAALARKEAELRRQMQQIQADKAAMKATEDKYKNEYVPKSRFKEDLMGLLQENGVDYEQLTQLALNQPGPQDQMFSKLQKEIQSLKQSQVEAQTKAQEAQTKQYEQAVTNIRNEVKVLVDADENYDTIKQSGSQEAVVELIKESFEKDGTLLTVEDASKQVEEYLVEEALKMASFKKIKDKLSTPEPVAAPVAAQKPKVTAAEPLKQPIKTLTNAQASTSTGAFTKKERRERAIAAFRGQL